MPDWRRGTDLGWMPNLHCCSIPVPFFSFLRWRLARTSMRPLYPFNINCRVIYYLQGSVELDSADALDLLFGQVTLCCFLLVLARSMGGLLHSSISQGLPLLLALEKSLFVLDIFQNYDMSAFTMSSIGVCECRLTLSPFSLVCFIARSQSCFNRDVFPFLYALNGLPQHTKLSFGSTKVVCPLLLQP